MSQPRIKVLTRPKQPREQTSQGELTTKSSENVKRTIDLSAFKLKHESEAGTFKLINARGWNTVDSEPTSESQYFCDGNPAMSVISVIGPFGAGKSSLLNKIAFKRAFRTHNKHPAREDCAPSKLHTRHTTRGIDIHATHHRILLDCQPLLSTSVSEDFRARRSFSPFRRDTAADLDPCTSSHMISLQLTAFLMATCDYVVLMNKTLDDSSQLQLIASALVLLGETSYKAKLVIFCEDKAVCERRFRDLATSCLGMNRVDRFFCDERELINYISSYTSDKCEQLEREPSGLSGRRWLTNARNLWNQTLRNSSLVENYAKQLQRTNNQSGPKKGARP